MKIICLLIFVVSSVIHLYASSTKNRKMRNITKPFILLALIGYYYISTNDPSIIFILALLFSWLGDVLLIPKGIPWFTAGGIAFIFSHLFFIQSYIHNISFTKSNLPIVLIAAIIYFIIVCIVFKHLKKYLIKPLTIPMFIYLLTNGAMNCFALLQFLSHPNNIFALITYIGALSFFISDSNLFFVRFKKEYKDQNHFVVMFTYIVAEFLIVLGTIYF